MKFRFNKTTRAAFKGAGGEGRKRVDSGLTGSRDRDSGPSSGGRGVPSSDSCTCPEVAAAPAHWAGSAPALGDHSTALCGTEARQAQPHPSNHNDDKGVPSQHLHCLTWALRPQVLQCFPPKPWNAERLKNNWDFQKLRQPHQPCLPPPLLCVSFIHTSHFQESIKRKSPVSHLYV